MQSHPTALTRLVIEHSPSSVAMFDTQMRYVCCSHNWIQNFGLGEKSLTGLSHYEVFPDLPERWRNVHQRCLAGETLRCDEDIFIRKDGKTEWLRWEVTPYFDNDKNVLGIIIFSEVITERIQAAQKLKASVEWLEFLNEAILRLWKTRDIQHGLDEILKTALSLSQTQKGYIQLLNNRNNNLYIKGHQGFNQTFLSLCGELKTTANTVCALSYRTKAPVILDDIEQKPDYAEHMELVRKNNFRSVQSIPLLNREGLPMAIISVHSPEAYHFTPEINQRMQLYAHYAEAFLERKKYQTELKNSNSRLEKRVNDRTRELSDALLRVKEAAEIKSRFFSMASHEFRTPLSVVISSADLARLHAIKGNFEKHEKHIQRIKNSAKNLTELLNNSLTADKLEQGFILPESSHFNIKKTIEEVVADLNDLCMENQTIRCIHNGNEEIITDRKILKNILFNLVTNAIKYSQKEVIITTNSYLGKMEISVKDNGIGIPVKEQKHVFSRFFRASNVSHIQGIGIGLNIVHSYARVLRGSVDFISSKRKGTIFTLSIPDSVTFENVS